MGTTTSNFQFQKPTVGSDLDVWGSDYSTGDPLTDPSPGLNGNWEKLDQMLKVILDRIDEEKIAAQIPINGLFLSTVATNPATLLGYGTWVVHAAGRALVGVGNNGETSWGIDEERGSETHTLALSETPAHTHSVPAQTVTTTTAGSHTHPYSGAGTGSGLSQGPSSIGISGRTTGAAGDHDHEVTIPSSNTNSRGGGNAHNNIQPSIGVRVWRRTA